MEETARTLEDANYELDSEYESVFKMLNGANFTNRDGIEFAGLDGVYDDKGENAS